ncbi:MAG: ATP-binding protein, partial [archaeon GB-1867-035]|nr:ATP-binding protein [Candidatus Culexmicrobium profundum]
LVLKAIAEEAKSWSSVRRYVEEKMGVTIPKSSLTRIIKKLEKLSIVKNYEFLDPIYERASKKL